MQKTCHLNIRTNNGLLNFFPCKQLPNHKFVSLAENHYINRKRWEKQQWSANGRTHRSWDVISAVCTLNGWKFTPSSLIPIWYIFMLLSRSMPTSKYSEYLILSHYLPPSLTYTIKWSTLPCTQTFTLLASHFISIWFWTLSWLYRHSCYFSLMVSSFCPSMSSFLLYSDTTERLLPIGNQPSSHHVRCELR